MRGDDDQSHLPSDHSTILPVRTLRLSVQFEAVRLEDCDEGGEIHAG